MSQSKRLYDDLDEGEVSTEDEPSPKRAKRLTGAPARHHHQSSAIDPTWGQKYVFSSIQDASSVPLGDESDFEDDADAMAYLRSVRLEASGIPHLLVAPKRQIGPQLPPELQAELDDDDDDDEARELRRNTGSDDATAYYQDGAYVARPSGSEDGQDTGEAGDDGDHVSRELHTAYFASILDRYRRLRSMLHALPPPNARRRLSPTQPTYAAPLGRSSSTAKTWSHALRTADPQPLQLALMTKDSVLRVLRIMLGGRFLRRGYTLSERTSRWLWGLLARLPDPWELDHTELAWVRDLGRRAVLLGRSLAEMAALRAELEHGVLGVHEAVDASGSDDGPASHHAHDDGAADEPRREGDDDDDGGDDAVDAVQESSTDAEQPESESVAMDLASDSDQENNATAADDDQALQAAKRALLSRFGDGAAPAQPDAEAAMLRLRINMRATLDMILTVAGEFYGQRDLLEFREPFVGL